MPKEYGLDLTEIAKADLDYYPAGVRKAITEEIRFQLSHEPLTLSRNRKELRDHPIASWELRCGRYRVFYEVDEKSRQVSVISVGHKERERLLVRGRVVKL